MPKFATDPPVSEKQRKAMFAAASGNSTLGIPESVGKKFVGMSKDARKKITKDMTQEDWDELERSLFKFFSEEEEEPEHSEDDTPWQKLHYAAKMVPKVIPIDKGYLDGQKAQDIYALDEQSTRFTDKDGHLHVQRTPISKANVCGYLGREIPNWRALGLNPDRMYRLYRHPDELKKAADTFNNKPLLSKHVPVDADHHPKELVEGSIGTNAEFEHPFLYNSLAAYTREAIQGIEDKTKRELSSAYRYTADMTPGTSPEGEAYDGIMRNIIGNHVALVPAGRAGSDVVVGDEALKTLQKGSNMPKVLTHKASVVKGSLMGYLAPRLATDAELDLNPIVSGITNTNYPARRNKIVADITKACEGKLAEDAKLDGLSEYLGAFDEMKEDEEDDKDKKKGEDKKAKDTKAKDKKAMDKKAKDETAKENAEGEEDEEAEDTKDDEDDKKNEAWDKAMKHARDCGMDEDDLEAMDKIMRGARDAEEETEEEREEDKGKDKKAKDTKAKDKKHGMDKHAMDSAIAKAEARISKNFQEVRNAERFVRDWVGDLSPDIAFDSAEEVFAYALETMGEDVSDIHPSAYKPLLSRLPKPGAKTTVRTKLAQDSKGVSLMEKHCPDALRIVQA